MNHSKPNTGIEEAQAAYDAVMSGDLATGKICEKFENEFIKQLGYRHALALNSGTSALMLALIAVGVKAGDEVIVSPYTMVASVNVVLSVGAVPVFADIDPDTYNITPETVARAITQRTKAVLPVDIFGNPCDAEGIKRMLPHDVFMIQDTIEALGSTYKGQAVGHVADACAYGFFPNKQITTGIGGMFCTNNTEIYNAVRALSRHGVQSTVSGGDMNSQGYGYNFRMSDVSAAIGLVQMQRFEEIKMKMAVIRGMMDNYFGKWRLQKVLDGSHRNDFVYVVQVSGIDKDTFIKEMADLGIPVKQYFIALNTLPHLKPYVRHPLPAAEHIAASTLALPYHYDLTSLEISEIYNAFTKLLVKYGVH